MTSASNSGQLRPFTARELIEEATSRCGIKPVQLTSEIVEKSLDQLNLMLPALINRGVQLWKRQRIILPVYENEMRVPLPPGIDLVNRLTRRSLARYTGGIPFSTDHLGVPDGNAAAAFDDDFATSCSQTLANGNIGMFFPQPVQVTNLGVLFDVAMELAYFIEYSNDAGVTWTPVDALTGVVSAGQWVWSDVDGSPSALGWRVRAVGTTALDVAEIFFGYMPSEIPLDPWNLDEYNSMPNKTASGRVVNWYQQRDLSAPYLMVWQVPDKASRYDQLCVWVNEYIDTVAEPTQSLDVPRRWYDAVTSMLARRLCRSLPEADMARYPMLRAEEQEAVELAEGEERDPAPSNYDMGIGAYNA
jgi:hypothetical protein